ncbi:MAG: helix-turn-helix transcriptional regulator [Francisellaceae bacterium]
MDAQLERHFYLYDLIPTEPNKITITQLHRKMMDNFAVSVDRKTVKRSVDKLIEQVPVVQEQQGRTFYYYWPKDKNYFKSSKFSPDLALYILFANNYLNKMVPLALTEKIAPVVAMAEKELEKRQIRSKISWLDKVAIVSRNNLLRPMPVDQTVFDHVNKAVYEEKVIDLEYLSRHSKKAKWYRGNPLGLYMKDHAIYLIFQSFKNRDTSCILSLHLGRIKSLELSDEYFSYPKDFRLSEYLRSQASKIDYHGRHQVVLHFYNHDDGFNTAEQFIENQLSSDQSWERYDELIKLKATVEVDNEFIWWLQGFGSDIEVMKPMFLRERMSKMHQKAVSRYSDNKEGSNRCR